MTALQAVVLGIVQGLTEFLPISSSGHLVLVPWILGWEFDPQIAFIFDVLVQWGTLLAVIAYFWSDLKAIIIASISAIKRRTFYDDPESRLLVMILVASIPAFIAGMIIKPLVEGAFENPIAVSFFLLGNALILALGERLGKRQRELGQLTIGDSIWVGLAQILALFPGISRSGVTLSAGMTRDLKRLDSGRFSFLMAIPVMLGAGIIALVDLYSIGDANAFATPLLIGFVIAAIVGYLAIRWLLSFLVRHPLTVFAIYCAVVGLAGIVLGFLRG
ncbi:MAG: undecaprenyl-diphosphatase UppP [Anaerolineales bacterium]|nr:undecaprenyl-diphosphatase UppP [Anaerolineales bacterium]